MVPLQIRMFGKLCVLYNGKPLANFDAQKVQELFCYLLLHHDRPHAREHLASLLWADCPTAQSKSYLRKALWQLQSALNSLAAQASHMIRIEADFVQLQITDDMKLDIAIFEEIYRHVKSIHGQNLSAEDAHALEGVVDSYTGDLLEGWYQDWCIFEREHYQRMYLALLDKLMSYYEAHETYEAATELGMRILRHDQAHERTHYRLMRLYYLAGDRTAALRQFERCVAVLEQELGIRPDPSTVTLYKQIRANASGCIHSEANGIKQERTGQVTDALDWLKRFQHMLIDVQRQVQQDIQVLEQSLEE